MHTRFSCIKKWIFKLVISCDLKSEINQQGQHIRSFQYLNFQYLNYSTQGAPGRTLEELEQQIVPGSKGHAMTAEDLERQLRGEGQKPPPLPEPHLHHPPPGFLPGSHGPRNQTPQVSQVAYTETSKQLPPVLYNSVNLTCLNICPTFINCIPKLVLSFSEWQFVKKSNNKFFLMVIR